jgi:hypothetical protein
LVNITGEAQSSHVANDIQTDLKMEYKLFASLRNQIHSLGIDLSFMSFSLFNIQNGHSCKTSK